MKNTFQDALEEIVAKDSRFSEQAYFFIREALDYTIKILAKPLEGPGRHVKGPELLDGIRRFALQEYGPMTLTVLNRWGIQECSDFGDLVFNLVDSGVLGKTDDDCPQDFADGYEFYDAFRRPYLPEEAWAEEVETASDDRSPRAEC